MIAFALQRREELKLRPESRAAPIQTSGVGSEGNISHLYGVMRKKRRKSFSALRRAAAIREMADLGCSQTRAAILMNCHRQVVNRICRRYRIEMAPSIDVERREEMLRSMAARGMSRQRMADALGLSRTRIHSLIHEFGITDAAHKGRGISTITRRRIAALHEFASLGLSQNQAAILFDMEPSSVSYLCKTFGVQMADKRGRRPMLAKLILRDYGKPGMTYSAMAERYGTSTGSISVTVHRLRKEGKLPPVQQRC